MSRHRFLQSEVDGYADYKAAGDDFNSDDDDDDGVERRVDMNDGCRYTKEEFETFYGGTFEWDGAKPAKPKADKKKKKKGGGGAGGGGCKPDAGKKPAPPLAFSSSSLPTAVPHSPVAAAAPVTAACPACTFENKAYRTRCEICDAALAPSAPASRSLPPAPSSSPSASAGASAGGEPSGLAPANSAAPVELPPGPAALAAAEAEATKAAEAAVAAAAAAAAAAQAEAAANAAAAAAKAVAVAASKAASVAALEAWLGFAGVDEPAWAAAELATEVRTSEDTRDRN